MKFWIKTEDQQWINLDQAYWIFVKGKPNDEGFWEVCVDFMKADCCIFEIASYPTKEAAQFRMDEIMNSFKIRKEYGS